jgi:hypothetical protein
LRYHSMVGFGFCARLSTSPSRCGIPASQALYTVVAARRAAGDFTYHW